MTESQAREAICQVGLSLFQRRLVHATAGNISVRLDDGFLITPTDACLGQLDPAQLARLDPQGRQLSGARASKTLALHQRIYQAAQTFDAQTRCVIHSHSTHCVALSLRPGAYPGPFGPELLPPVTPYFIMKVGHVPLLPYHRPGDPAVADLVAERIKRYGQAGHPIRAVMLQRLGPNVWHDSPEQAMAVLDELEETAQLCQMAPAQPLNPAQIDELRQQFGARWACD
jgi:ribulose-5-phosphate 4-epimerase/fuculose-1-phosphate aldolase